MSEAYSAPFISGASQPDRTNHHTDTANSSGIAKICLAIGETVKSKDTRNKTLNWDQLKELFKIPEIGTKDGRYFCRGSFSRNTRSNGNMSLASVLVFEVDSGHDLSTNALIEHQGPDPALVHEYLKEKEITHCIYTSFSSLRPNKEHWEKLKKQASENGTSEEDVAAIPMFFNGHKYRIVCPISRRINDTENKVVIKYFFDVLREAGIGVATAEESMKMAQPWYLPRVENEEAKDSFRFFEFFGAPVDVEGILGVSAHQSGVPRLKNKPDKKQKPEHKGLAIFRDSPDLLVQRLKPEEVDERLLTQAVNGDKTAIETCVDLLLGTPAGFKTLLHKHGYEPASSDELRWRKPDSTHTPGVNIFQREDGGWLLTSHHQNDPLHDSERSAINFMSAFIRLECKDIAEKDRYGEGIRRLRMLVAKRLEVVKAKNQRMSAGSGSSDNRSIGDIDFDQRLDPCIELLTPSSAREKLVWIESGDQVLHLENDRAPVSMKVARSKYAASEYSETVGKKVRSIPVLEIWLRDPQRLSYEVAGFHPAKGREFASPEGYRAVNLWKPIHRDGQINQAKVDLFLDHIHWLFGERADDFLNWLAHIEQHPGILPHRGWLHIATQTGLGRNWIAGVLAKVWIGYVAPNVDLIGMLNDGFTDELSMKLLAQVDELKEGGGDRWEHSERLKSMLNCEYRSINRKGVPKYKEHNFCRWLLFSNHLDALPLAENDRRVEVVISESQPKPREYYDRLYVMLDDPDFISSLGLWFRDRDLTCFEIGAVSKRDSARARVMDVLKSDDRRVIEHLITTWPSDLISNPILAAQLNGSEAGGKAQLSKSQVGIAKHAGVLEIKPISINGGTLRIKALRNHHKWSDPSVTTGMIRAELEKAVFTGP